MNTVTKTEALKIARAAVGHPHGHGTSWKIYGPFRVTDIGGPSTSTEADGYSKAVARRAVWVARIALAQMGKLDEDAEYTIYNHGPGSALALVNAVVK